MHCKINRGARKTSRSSRASDSIFVHGSFYRKILVFFLSFVTAVWIIAIRFLSREEKRQRHGKKRGKKERESNNPPARSEVKSLLRNAYVFTKSSMYTPHDELAERRAFERNGQKTTERKGTREREKERET